MNFSSNHLHHAPKNEFSGNSTRDYPEKSNRINWILDELQSFNELNIIDLTTEVEKYLSLIHSQDYIDFIKSVDSQPSGEYAPTVFSINPRNNKTTNFHANLGNYFIDPSTPIMPGTFKAASSAVSSAIQVGKDLLKSRNISIGLSRPPGHHATKSHGGGYCIFNNVAILAKYLLNQSKSVTILDLDYHHGNGTQEIFYETDKVQYVSLHADTKDNYPFYWGHKDEKGKENGLGFNVNLPLDNLISESGYFDELDQGILEINEYQPDIVLISMGFDSYHLDPIAGLSLNQSSYKKIGNLLSNFSKLGIILEGGYHQDIGICFAKLIQGLGIE